MPLADKISMHPGSIQGSAPGTQEDGAGDDGEEREDHQAPFVQGWDRCIAAAGWIHSQCDVETDRRIGCSRGYDTAAGRIVPEAMLVQLMEATADCAAGAARVPLLGLKDSQSLAPAP